MENKLKVKSKKLKLVSSRPPPPAGRAGNRRGAGFRGQEGDFVAANFSSP